MFSALSGNVSLQLDGAYVHYIGQLRQMGDNKLPEYWNAGERPIDWRTRSPDFMSLDLLLLESLKDIVRRMCLSNLPEMKRIITLDIRLFTKNTLKDEIEWSRLSIFSWERKLRPHRASALIRKKIGNCLLHCKEI